MALTQQFARVAPPEGLLDAGWAVWGLIRHCRASGADCGAVTLLQRAVDGDPGSAGGFLDHHEVYDGFGDPPRLLAPDAVVVIVWVD
ncbi:hypothetical protein AB0D34_07555 [Streptomyces sp. NPDC048420]|uniref:hypothetical protein n=1 Tax=Streptomyces sp. NPDC048420 TaxID=3155755 RepID=UPI0034180F4D